jgi:hypothetical protein
MNWSISAMWRTKDYIARNSITDREKVLFWLSGLKPVLELSCLNQDQDKHAKFLNIYYITKCTSI